MRNLGVFDIGSNTLLLTLGRKTGSDKIEILLDIGEVLRLSEGLQEGGPLKEEAKARMLAGLGEFKRKAEALGVDKLIAAGTAAFRRASDGAQFAKRIHDQLGIPVRILGGEEEAAYSYASAWQDFGKPSEGLGMIDIGGGSTELVFSPQGPRFSLPIGTVRLTEKFVTAHPIADSEWDQIRNHIQTILRDNLSPKPSIPPTWVAVAATPASLAAVLMKLPAYDPERVHGFRMPREALAKLVEELRQKVIAERNRMPGMDPKRSELLPIGGLILLAVAEFLSLGEITVSDHGLRYGILFEELSKS